MAQGDYYDDYGNYYPDAGYDVPAAAAPPQGDRRQQIIDGIIVPDFTAIAGRAPKPDEIEEAYAIYERFGGDAFRNQVQQRFPAASSGGGGTLAQLAIPESYPAYSGPMRPDLSGLPEAPGFEWTPTQASDVFADPSYDFRFGQGERAYKQGAAARGLLRTGGTLKGLIDYGQNFASQEFGNVDARRFRDALARFTPRFNAWQTQYGVGANAAQSAFDRAWDAYQMSSNDAYRRQTFNADDAWRRDNAILNSGLG